MIFPRISLGGTLDISSTGFHSRDGAFRRPRACVCEMNGRSRTPQRGVPTMGCNRLRTRHICQRFCFYKTVSVSFWDYCDESGERPNVVILRSLKTQERDFWCVDDVGRQGGSAAPSGDVNFWRPAAAGRTILPTRSEIAFHRCFAQHDTSLACRRGSSPSSRLGMTRFIVLIRSVRHSVQKLHAGNVGKCSVRPILQRNGRRSLGTGKHVPPLK